MTSREVVASDGVRLAAQERGDPANPTVLAVHGYPDDHSVWDGVAAQLADRFHVVTYDVRGAGRSQAPPQRSGYLLDQLERDLAAVADAVSPQRPVHLLAHDWGSIQSWHAVTGQRMRGRIASFTSISGPCLDHAGFWFRSRLRRPGARRLRELVVQLVCSGYIGFFRAPLLPELAWRSRVLPALLAKLARADDQRDLRSRIADGVRGLELYRANVLARLLRPTERRAEVPVQVLAPTGDLFVSPALQLSDLHEWAGDLRTERVPGGHWLPRNRPGEIARRAAAFVEHVESAQRTAGG